VYAPGAAGRDTGHARCETGYARGTMIGRLVLFGASGDLAGRFLLPALAALKASGRLPDDFSVTGAAAENWDDERFRAVAEQHLAEHADAVPAGDRAALVRSLRYRQVDVADPASLTDLLKGVGGTDDSGSPVAVYLALPPSLFSTTVQTLAAIGLPPGSRVALEKPFGDDLAGARALNALLDQVTGDAGEQAVFRVDDVLGMATVQNFLGMRAANPWLSAAWNGTQIEQIDVLWEETLALEGRAGYYDGAGALKDVLQNHMLQVLALIAMEPPRTLGEQDLRDAKVAALQAVRDLLPEEVATRTRRARYTAGRLADTGGADGGEVPDYGAEDGVDPERGTETYADLFLEVDTPRWAGTRFRLRTGKALSARRKGVLVRFRPPGSGPVADDPPPAGQLWVGLDGPDDIHLRMAGRSADRGGSGWVPLTLHAEPPSSVLPAYGRVLLDFLTGGSALSVRGDEAEEAWRVVTPVLSAWAGGRPPLLDYPAGSAGLPPPEGMESGRS
jgi:glucose-6-phosphate 1-dehydrogenase